MTVEERLAALEKENEELKRMIRNVAELAYFAYNDMQTSRESNLENEVRKIWRERK